MRAGQGGKRESRESGSQETASAVNHRHMWGHPASSWEDQDPNNALEAAPCGGKKHAVRVCFYSSHQVDDEDRRENSQENLIIREWLRLGIRARRHKKNCAHLLPRKPRISDPSRCRILFAENGKISLLRTAGNGYSGTLGWVGKCRKTTDLFPPP